jgi:predicted transposase/invertase (TIGR01784 family)
MAAVRKSKTEEPSGSSPNDDASKILFDDAGVYINPLTDFGFKRIFGTDANKDLLIDFLNVVLNIDGGIKDLSYTNPEKQGRKKADPKVIFDLHCITGKGERIIIEMQNLSQTFFKDRALYYATFPIQEQGEKRKKWNYQLQPVYLVNIVNFLLNKSQISDKYASYIRLSDRDTHEVFYDKLTFVYLELPRFTKDVTKLETDVERWMYVLKHLSRLNNLPQRLRTRVFTKLFKQAKIANMTQKELDEYQQSLKNYRDMHLIEDEYKSTIAARDKVIAANARVIAAKDRALETMEKNYKKILARKDAAIAKKDAENKKNEAIIAELKRKYGVN